MPTPDASQPAGQVVTRESFEHQASPPRADHSSGGLRQAVTPAANADEQKAISVLKPPCARRADPAERSAKAKVVDRQSFFQQAENSKWLADQDPEPRIVYRQSFLQQSGSREDGPYVYPPNGIFRLTSMLLQTQPPSERTTQPPSERTTQPPSAGTTPGANESMTPSPSLSASEVAQAISPASASNIVTNKTAQDTASTDLGGALTHPEGAKTVTTQQRSPVSQDPNIRGYKGGQIYTQANGVYWTPARRDLDTMLSKIDPDMMQDVVVVPGPYGLRYGPGLAFIDVVRQPVPRSETGCYESHFDQIGNVRSNGGQVYGREIATGAGADWGFRMSYGDRAGSDFKSGDGTLIPSSYHNRDAWAN